MCQQQIDLSAFCCVCYQVYTYASIACLLFIAVVLVQTISSGLLYLGSWNKAGVTLFMNLIYLFL